MVYINNYDEAFFVTKFIAGLRREIKNAIRLHHPRTVDAALALALTQEDMLEEGKQYTVHITSTVTETVADNITLLTKGYWELVQLKKNPVRTNRS